ncbi:MAG: hypothetical protein H0W70_08975, partial [Actinobacteria bacterium]|nr:hypothetical protein [Actinomycetota bacterium]
MPSGIVTVLATDVDDSPALRALIETYGGEATEPGTATFASAVSACACAIAVQATIDAKARVGLHVGEADGDPAAVARSLCAQAGAGQILASQLVIALAGARGTFDAVPAPAEPAPAYELRWRTESPTAPLPPAVARELDGTPFAGRT